MVIDHQFVQYLNITLDDAKAACVGGKNGDLKAFFIHYLFYIHVFSLINIQFTVNGTHCNSVM